LAELGWNKVNFVIAKSINGEKKESQSHEIDHVRKFNKGTVVLEIEWNNKDPFFDRDLENFKRLHAEGGRNFTRYNCDTWHIVAEFVDRFGRKVRAEAPANEDQRSQRDWIEPDTAPAEGNSAAGRSRPVVRGGVG